MGARTLPLPGFGRALRPSAEYVPAPLPGVAHPLPARPLRVGWRARLGRGTPRRPLLSRRSPRPQAIVTLGAAAGGVLGGWLVDRAGRKLSLLLCAVPFVAGFTVITAAQNVWMLLGGRLLTGLACGIASLVAPVSVSPSLAPWDSGEGADLGALFPPGCGLLPAWHHALSLLRLPYTPTGLGNSRCYCPWLQMK